MCVLCRGHTSLIKLHHWNRYMGRSPWNLLTDVRKYCIPPEYNWKSLKVIFKKWKVIFPQLRQFCLKIILRWIFISYAQPWTRNVSLSIWLLDSDRHPAIWRTKVCQWNHVCKLHLSHKAVLSNDQQFLVISSFVWDFFFLSVCHTAGVTVSHRI